jgi:hypothetical protein
MIGFERKRRDASARRGGYEGHVSRRRTMTYRIAGLDPAQFAPLWAMEPRTRDSARRAVTADADAGFPCRVTLEDARAGERLVLVHHVHHEVETPYRSAFAIFVREDAAQAAVFEDRCPPCFAGRTLSLRGFDGDGALAEARLAVPGEADAAIRALLSNRKIAYINAHNAAAGCFAARIERDGQ